MCDVHADAHAHAHAGVDVDRRVCGLRLCVPARYHAHMDADPHRSELMHDTRLIFKHEGDSMSQHAEPYIP